MGLPVRKEKRREYYLKNRENILRKAKERYRAKCAECGRTVRESERLPDAIREEKRREYQRQYYLKYRKTSTRTNEKQEYPEDMTPKQRRLEYGRRYYQKNRERVLKYNNERYRRKKQALSVL